MDTALAEEIRDALQHYFILRNWNRLQLFTVHEFNIFHTRLTAVLNVIFTGRIKSDVPII